MWVNLLMFTLLCAISIQILKFFCKDRRLLLYMSRTLHLFGTDWCAMMVPIQVIRWYRMQCYDGTDSCATVVPIRRYCHGIVLADNPTPYIKIGKDKIDFGKSYNPDLIEMSGLIFPNFYKEYGNIVYRYGSNLKCSFWNKTLDYVGLMPPSVPDNIQLYNLIYPRFV